MALESEKTANKLKNEITERYNELIGTLILIATSKKKKKEKISEINKYKKKFKEFNNKFSSSQVEKIYKISAKEATEEAKNIVKEINIKKNILPKQQQEINLLKEQLEIGLNKRLDVITEQAKQLTNYEEIKKVREQIGMSDGTEKLQIDQKKTKKNLVFINSKGQRVNMNTVMELTVGDSFWLTITSSQRSQWLLLGFKYFIHMSKIDERTTVLCRSLHLQRRDLRKDPIPPLHPRCRSKIKLSKEDWSSDLSLKNYGKVF